MMYPIKFKEIEYKRRDISMLQVSSFPNLRLKFYTLVFALLPLAIIYLYQNIIIKISEKKGIQ